MTEKIDTSQAEKWLDTDTFIYKGKIYRLYGFEVKEVSPDRKKELHEKISL